MPSSEYTVNILIKSKDQTSKPTTTAKKSIVNLKNALKVAAAAMIALKAAQKGIEFVKFGARVDRAATALDNLAKGAGTSGDAIIKSIQVASGFTIDRMSAMEAANKALLLEVVKTPEEFAALTKNAVLLGRAMGEDAATSVDKFTRAAGRQSKLIADDLGLKIDLVKVQEETNRLMEADASLTEDAAKARGFFNVMMAEATRKTAVLEGQQADAATQIEMLTASWKTLTQQIGENVAESAAETGAIEKTSDAIRVQTEMLDLLEQASKRAGGTRVAMGRGVQASVAKAIISSRTWQKDEDELRKTIEETTVAIGEMDEASLDVARAVQLAEQVIGREKRTMREYESATRDAAAETKRLADEQEALASKAFLMDAAADFTSFAKLQARDAKDLAEDKESIEQEHAENLLKIQKKGWSTAVKFDALAEQEKLDTLKWKLGQALLQQTEFTDKTRQSVRNAKEFQIANLQEEIAAKEQAFADFEAGRLVKAGQNITGLLTQEQARYDEEKRLLDESRIEQEIAQKESLGRMVLANWTAWADINKVAQEEIFKTQLFIQEKYGLITAEGAAMALATVEDFKKIREHGIATWTDIEDKRQRYRDNLAAMAEKTFDIRIRTIHETVGASSPGATIPTIDPGMASGGTARGGEVLLGELGPERVRLPRGSQVTPASQTTNNYHFEQVVNTRATQHSIMDDFALAEAMAA